MKNVGEQIKIVREDGTLKLCKEPSKAKPLPCRKNSSPWLHCNWPTYDFFLSQRHYSVTVMGQFKVPKKLPIDKYVMIRFLIK